MEEFDKQTNPRSHISGLHSCSAPRRPPRSMAFNHGSAQTLNPQLQQRPSESHATHLSLRRTDRLGVAHPLKQNPPSIAEDRFDDIDITDSILQPPPSALTAATTYDPHESSSPLEDFSPSPRTLHQRSLTGSVFDNCQPFLKRATSTIQQHTSRASLHSPTKSLASFIPSRSVIESTASQPKIKAGAKALQSWFNGSSAPVRVGIQSHSEEHSDEEDYESEEEEEMMINIFSRGPALTGESPTETAPKQPAPKPKAQSRPQISTASSRFAWLLSTQYVNTNTLRSTLHIAFRGPSTNLVLQKECLCTTPSTVTDLPQPLRRASQPQYLAITLPAWTS